MRGPMESACDVAVVPDSVFKERDPQWLIALETQFFFLQGVDGFGLFLATLAGERDQTVFPKLGVGDICVFKPLVVHNVV